MNFVDGLFVSGQYQIKPSLPFVPGSKVAGHVVSVGPDVPRWPSAIGCLRRWDWVASPPRRGPGVYRHRPARRHRCARAATFTQSYSTSLFALGRLHAAPGETVLVLGAGGGVGLSAIGMARASGCRVLGVASARKNDRQRSMPVQRPCSTRPRSRSRRRRAWAGGTGVDLVVDPIGGVLAEQALRALGDRGRYLVIGFTSGDIRRFRSTRSSCGTDR